jgi:hypothetical protein
MVLVRRNDQRRVSIPAQGGAGVGIKRRKGYPRMGARIPYPIQGIRRGPGGAANKKTVFNSGVAD